MEAMILNHSEIETLKYELTMSLLAPRHTCELGQCATPALRLVRFTPASASVCGSCQRHNPRHTDWPCPQADTAEFGSAQETLSNFPRSDVLSQSGRTRT